MSPNFHDTLRKALKRSGYRSLTAFYQAHDFSFSYEYLRQIYVEQKLPTAQKVAELAAAFGLSEARLQKMADEFRLSRAIRKHYKHPHTTRSGRVAEQLKQYGRGAKLDLKIQKLLEQLGDEQKEQVLVYLQFLRKQWEKKPK